MVTIEGELKIRIIHGRNGPFAVGDLTTSIGQFAVKDVALDQYDEGRYHGKFTIDKIAMSSYTPKNSSFTIHEMRAFLNDFVLFDVDDSPVEQEPIIQDPLDEEVEPDKTVETRQPKTKTKPAEKPKKAAQKPGGAKDDDLETLFGMLWPLGDRVKLDPSCDRGVFRQQKEALKNQLGYRFDPMSQEWFKS